ncbi:hypothetical protein H310_09783 [Aphanomyces invadans]|uniref:Apple domain-containing protein n=1 Tax=Aphanomyces invadans TaxID=157072 RepID=A0A024TSD7_9STRA|nr:hypothetical protein H310_09783 [Aphanomyces invadans]ETV96918.1 hypothetical protein H310_09783 [Aphanomyces invadans]|eukprot:XP_008874164.1 hypothetical protein H310_09783 [Aphanomyces invadans]
MKLALALLFLIFIQETTGASTSYDCIKGKDFLHHGDLSNSAIDTIDECKAACTSDDMCNALAFTKNRCYLKVVAQDDVLTKVVHKKDVVTCVLSGRQSSKEKHIRRGRFH